MSHYAPGAMHQMERMVQDLKQLYHERNAALEEVSRAHHEALLRLSLAAEYRDDDTGVHIVRIGFLAEAVALCLGQSAEFAKNLRLAAPMHDVGKIATPDAVLKKPGPLDASERAVMNTHPANGAAILGRSRIPLFQMAAEIALTHHERWDGRGYPSGLMGTDIPLSGRIVSVVDFFDALTMDRVYRPAYPVDTAIAMLHDERAKAFDPSVVDAFMDHSQMLVDLHRHITENDATFEQLIEGL
ncbi:HD domain-containing phosphohydrolase [uncultured Xylophilus sp.]|uniref:HD-GYP domain-containing protein n=1 Tax=uncultured Xylophilus sp. TaxID=296832 RepID=UPI0025F6961C|nr:HD domain-containing phosphohydrolase [uncultured Xylophilus sp.]